MEIFRGQNLIEFTERFKTDEDCKKYLSQVKWRNGYTCRKCGHTKYQERKNFSRTCNHCSDTESPMANTLFHKVKFGLRKAFFMCFEMATTTKSLSASQMSVRFGVRENTARFFMHKVRQAMKSSENYPMDGNVHIDEFVVGGKEEGKPGRSYDSKKKKSICAVELTEDGKVKRFYALKIKDFSAKSLRTIFDKHVSTEAHVTTDEWKSYRPIMKDYKIDQIPSNNGSNFKALHTMIHQVKSWLRTTYSWVSEKNIERYFDEFSFNDKILGIYSQPLGCWNKNTMNPDLPTRFSISSSKVCIQNKDYLILKKTLNEELSTVCNDFFIYSDIRVFTDDFIKKSILII